MTVYRIADFGEYMELYGPGTVTTVKKPEEIEQLREWRRQWNTWKRKGVESDGTEGDYITFMIDQEW